MALIHDVFHLRRVPFLPVPLPHHSAKENASRDVVMFCMPQQGTEAMGMLVLSVPCPLPTLDWDLPSVCQGLWASQAG